MQRKVRVLLLITELEIGGAERVVYDLAAHLDRSRFEVEVAGLWGGPVAEWLGNAGIPTHDLEMRGKLDWDVFRRLRHLLRCVRPEVLHTHLFHASLLGRFAGWVERVPVVISTVHVLERERAFHPLLDGLTAPLVDRHVCVSDSVRQFMRRVTRIPESRLVVIPNGIDESRLSRESSSTGRIRGELGISPSQPLVVTVGRLHRQKGIDILLRALSRISGARWTALVIGTGPRAHGLARQVTRLGLSGRVHFLGYRSDAAGIASAADLFVLPSRWEGHPIVLLEAMAQSRCCLATRVAGSQDLIRHGDTGWLVPPESPVKLSRAIQFLLERPELRAQLGRQACDRVRAEFSLRTMVTTYGRLYDSLLSACSRSASRYTSSYSRTMRE